MSRFSVVYKIKSEMVDAFSVRVKKRNSGAGIHGVPAFFQNVPGGVMDCVTELASQGLKLFIRVGDKLWKHLRVHLDLAVGQHLLPIWLLLHLFFFSFFLLLTFFYRVNMGRMNSMSSTF